MPTLTVQVPEKAAAAFAALEGTLVDEYTLQTIVRDVLYEIQDEVHRLAGGASVPAAGEVQVLADRLAGCATALQAVNR